VKVTRVQVWRLFVWLITLISWVNAMRVLRQPDAWQFFSFWFLVAAATAAVGSLVAVLLVWFRRATADPHEQSVHRLT